MLRPMIVAVTLALPVAVQANEFQPVTDLSQFLSLVDGRELRLGLFGVSLRVTPDGQIEGSALGDPITGSWAWQDGFFCREMDWGGTVIPYNCQLVEAQGEEMLRFTVDQGAGDSAEFRLR